MSCSSPPVVAVREVDFSRVMAGPSVQMRRRGGMWWICRPTHPSQIHFLLQYLIPRSSHVFVIRRVVSQPCRARFFSAESRSPHAVKPRGVAGIFWLRPLLCCTQFDSLRIPRLISNLVSSSNQVRVVTAATVCTVPLTLY